MADLAEQLQAWRDGAAGVVEFALQGRASNWFAWGQPDRPLSRLKAGTLAVLRSLAALRPAPPTPRLAELVGVLSEGEVAVRNEPLPKCFFDDLRVAVRAGRAEVEAAASAPSQGNRLLPGLTPGEITREDAAREKIYSNSTLGDLRDKGQCGAREYEPGKWAFNKDQLLARKAENSRNTPKTYRRG